MIDMIQAITAQAELSFLTLEYLYPHIIDAIVFTSSQSSVTRWHETDLQCGLGVWMSADLHSVAVVSVIIGN